MCLEEDTLIATSRGLVKIKHLESGRRVSDIHKKLSFYAVAWTGKAATVYIRVSNGGAVSGDGSHAITASAGATGSGNDFTFTDVTDSDYYTFQLTGLTAASTVTISTSPDFTAASDRNTGRAIVLGVQVY